MIITDITLRKIEPSNGMRLTNGDVIAEKEVYLANSENPENWYEITEEEAMKIEEERNAENESLPDNR